MKENFFAQLQLPLLKAKDIENIVFENSFRLLNVFKTIDDYIKSVKTHLSGYEIYFATTIPDVSKGNCFRSAYEMSNALVNLDTSTVTHLGINSSTNNFVTNEQSSNLDIKLKSILLKTNPSVVTALLNSQVSTSSRTDVNKNKNVKNNDSSSEICSQQIVLTPEILDNSDCLRTDVNDNALSKTKETVLAHEVLTQSNESRISSVENDLPFSLNASSVSSQKTNLNEQEDQHYCKENQKSSEKKVNNEITKTENIESGNMVSFEEKEERALCVISEVVGNAQEAFSDPNNISGNGSELGETTLIIPKKTNDITKIKGWRRKQFFVEKPTTIEFYSFSEKSYGQKIDLPDTTVKLNEVEDLNNMKNAFVCETLDEFLDKDVDLKVSYEIPHLYAEVGIKLTSDDIVSRPNLSEEDFKEVETKYCIPVPTHENFDCSLKDIEVGIKRRNENETKTIKKLKLEENKLQKTENIEMLVEETEANLKQTKTISDNVCVLSRSQISDIESQLNRLNLITKLIGLVTYPNPRKPLHPLIRKHLYKLRSYHTKIDNNWANFAASVVCTNNRRWKRSILPVYMTLKLDANSKKRNTPVEVTNVIDHLLNSVVNANVKSSNKTKAISCKKVSTPSRQKRKVKKKNSLLVKIKNNIKECKVVIKKIQKLDNYKIWCMEHNCHNCISCGLKPPENKMTDEKEKFTNNSLISENKTKNFALSPQITFDKTLATLLARKLKVLKFNSDILTSIDSLKSKTPDTIELIKLNFVKQSFLTGYVNIWYLKPEFNCVRSRAFLTFTQEPPVSNAINLKSSGFSSVTLPKVITEIVSTENTFDSNDYAILHCNGEIWEIHGCLNLAVGKNENMFQNSDNNVEQIYNSAPLPELTHLQAIALGILRLKSAKWWILDLTQKFKEIEIKSGLLTAVMSRLKFFKFIKHNLFGFVSIKKDSTGRILGAYIFKKLLPFVLIGPYHLFENHELTLKGDSSVVPFVYYGEENTSSNYTLKFFINSVIMEFAANNKQLRGLWLYDKTCLDNTCYLEVMTSNAENLLPVKKYSIEMEHGYSLNSSPSALSVGSVSNILRKEIKEPPKKTVVYVYFEIFELGYLQGESQPDNSITISHPLDVHNKITSFTIGDWFIRLLKKRIHFFPEDLKLRWFVTKHKEDLRDRQPFNKFYLGGTHILCKKGLFFLLGLTEAKIKELGLNQDEVLKAVEKSQVISEVKELQNLASVLSENSNSKEILTQNLSMELTLRMGIEEIKKQKKLSIELLNAKKTLLWEKHKLVRSYLTTLALCPIEEYNKFVMIETLKSKIGGFDPEFIEYLKNFRFGQKYLRRSTENYAKEKKLLKKSKILNENNNESELRAPKKFKNLYTLSDKVKSSEAHLVIRGLKSKLTRLYNELYENPVFSESSKNQQVVEKLKTISGQLNSIKSIFHQVTHAESATLPTYTKPRILLKNTKAKKNFVNLNTKQNLPKNINVNFVDGLDELLNKNPEEILSWKLESDEYSVSNVLGISDAKNKGSKISVSHKASSDSSNNSLSQNKIIIVKNTKNNKTAIHKLNFSESLKSQNVSSKDNIKLEANLDEETSDKKFLNYTKNSGNSSETEVEIIKEILG